MHTLSPALLPKMSKEGHKAGSWVIKLCNGFWLGLTHCGQGQVVSVVVFPGVLFVLFPHRH